MTAAEIIALLEQQFGDRIKAKNLDAIDPFVVVEPADLLEVCRFLRDDPRLQLRPAQLHQRRRLPGAGPEEGAQGRLRAAPGSRLSPVQLPHRHRFVLKVILPRWKDNKPGELPEVPSVTALWRTADWHEREVYDLCGVWFTGHPEPDAHPAVGGLGRPSAAQGLRVSPGVSRHSRPIDGDR